LCVLLKGYEGYDKFGKERGRLSRRGVGEMEGRKAIPTAHGCLCASQYCSTAECAGWKTPILHVPCATEANKRTQ